jgi:hypothetical protein
MALLPLPAPAARMRIRPVLAELRAQRSAERRTHRVSTGESIIPTLRTTHPTLCRFFFMGACTPLASSALLDPESLRFVLLYLWRSGCRGARVPPAAASRPAYSPAPRTHCPRLATMLHACVDSPALRLLSEPGGLCFRPILMSRGRSGYSGPRRRPHGRCARTLPAAHLAAQATDTAEHSGFGACGSREGPLSGCGGAAERRCRLW